MSSSVGVGLFGLLGCFLFFLVTEANSSQNTSRGAPNFEYIRILKKLSKTPLGSTLNSYSLLKKHQNKKNTKAKLSPSSTFDRPCEENFRDFLLEGRWSYLLATGHSLGGAMSAISGLELAVKTQKPVQVVGVGTAIAGNQRLG